jgi:hypothetical protein
MDPQTLPAPLPADTLIEAPILPEWMTEPTKFAHYIDATRSLPGEPAEALCGAVFVPTQVASTRPVCPGCKAVYENRDAMANDWYAKGKHNHA